MREDLVGAVDFGDRRMRDPDLAAVFERLPNAFMVLDHELLGASRP